MSIHPQKSNFLSRSAQTKVHTESKIGRFLTQEVIMGELKERDGLSEAGELPQEPEQMEQGGR
jgi:hypothetical protein